MIMCIFQNAVCLKICMFMLSILFQMYSDETVSTKKPWTRDMTLLRHTSSTQTSQRQNRVVPNVPAALRTVDDTSIHATLTPYSTNITSTTPTSFVVSLDQQRLSPRPTTSPSGLQERSGVQSSTTPVPTPSSSTSPVCAGPSPTHLDRPPHDVLNDDDCVTLDDIERGVDARVSSEHKRKRSTIPTSSK